MKTSLVDRGSVERLLLLVGAVEAGLIDVLAGGEPLTAAVVARSAATDARATEVVLEALTAIGVVERSPAAPPDPPGEGDALYRLSPLGRAHLVDEGPELERSGLLHQVNKMRGWLELPAVIRTGEPSPRGTARRDVRSRTLAMGERDPAMLDEIVERCLAYAGTIETMLDVGGAVGHVARRFAVVGGRGHVVRPGGSHPGGQGGPGSRCGRHDAGRRRLTVTLPPGPFDLVYFGNVYYVYSRETNARVTRDAFAVTAPGGIVAIQGLFARQESRGRPVRGQHVALHQGGRGVERIRLSRVAGGGRLCRRQGARSGVGAILAHTRPASVRDDREGLLRPGSGQVRDDPVASWTEEVSWARYPTVRRTRLLAFAGSVPRSRGRPAFLLRPGQEHGGCGARILCVQLVPAVEWIRPDPSLLLRCSGGRRRGGLTG